MLKNSTPDDVMQIAKGVLRTYEEIRTDTHMLTNAIPEYLIGPFDIIMSAVQSLRSLHDPTPTGSTWNDVSAVFAVKKMVELSWPLKDFAFYVGKKAYWGPLVQALWPKATDDQTISKPYWALIERIELGDALPSNLKAGCERIADWDGKLRIGGTNMLLQRIQEAYLALGRSLTAAEPLSEDSPDQAFAENLAKIDKLLEISDFAKM